MKRSIFSSIIIALVIVIFAGLTYFLIEPFASDEVLNEEWSIYRDVQNRFEFSYPANFGIAIPDIRVDMPDGDLGEMFFFPQFSHGFRNGKIVLEGGLVARFGRTWVGAQALGGLYDPILAGGLIDNFPVAVQERLRSQAENLTISNFCSELSKSEHISIDDSVFNNVTHEQRQAIIGLDRMRNLNPEVIVCKTSDYIVVFHKKVVAQFGQVRNIQHIYGAIGFLNDSFTSVQFIRITSDSLTKELLETMTKVVRSFKVLH